MARKLKTTQQIQLLEKIKRLTDSGIHQTSIAGQLIKYGTRQEKEIGHSCKASLNLGQTMSIGFKGYLDQNAYLSVLSSEKAGDFATGINDAINSLQVLQASTLSIAKVLVKPILSMVTVCLVSALISKYAFPALERQFSRRRWNLISTLADHFGSFWLDYGLLIASVFLVVMVIVPLSLRFWVGDKRTYIDNLPIYRQYRFIQCTNLLTSIAHQTSIGTPMKDALRQYQKESGNYIKHHISKMLHTMRMGKTDLGAIFDTGLLIPEELDTLSLLNGIGDISETLKRSAQIHREKLELEIEIVKSWGKKIMNFFVYIFGGVMAGGLLLLAFDSITNSNLGI
ncbi:type II secretion system F family protein [Vibrio europaeus]|uniref:type II secretion system F family protein n=1 Tax=Vibrio europaeus TaxID=300876 RepID=UPI00233F5264|nr:type II secretion system F family protein [Vibrio europaeus]MDC5711155.1 type II secretion system F family protein [Vibrio europaeus]MDC5713184.1 type II secretion system F family protein [Vibrio europaeus]